MPLSLPAQDLRLPSEPSSVAVPAASAPAPDINSLKAEYREVYSALEAYSKAAFASPQNSPEFLEASASGRYLRARLEAVSSRLKALTGTDYGFRGPERAKGEVSGRIRADLAEVFGFDKMPDLEPGATRGVPIKQGYCQINFVKKNVPFLLQFDGFLKKGEVILTFDDGPGPLTEEVSTAMKAAGAPSVFFVLGSKLGVQGKEQIKKAAADGHDISVHGYWHATESGKPFTSMSTDAIIRQLGGVKASIAAASGARPAFFRPPYGIITPEALRAIDSDLGLVPVGWTIDTLDWSTKDPDALFENTVAMIKQRGKGIVLMHDVHTQSRTAAKRLVKWLADNGYKVVSPERMTQAYRGKSK